MLPPAFPPLAGSFALAAAHLPLSLEYAGRLAYPIVWLAFGTLLIALVVLSLRVVTVPGGP